MYGYDMYKKASHGIILSIMYLFGDFPLFLLSHQKFWQSTLFTVTIAHNDLVLVMYTLWHHNTFLIEIIKHKVSIVQKKLTN